MSRRTGNNYSGARWAFRPSRHSGGPGMSSDQDRQRAREAAQRVLSGNPAVVESTEYVRDGVRWRREVREDNSVTETRLSDDGRTVALPLTQEQALENLDEIIHDVLMSSEQTGYGLRFVIRDAVLNASPEVLAAAIPEDTLQQINLAYLRQPPREVSRGG